MSEAADTTNTTTTDTANAGTVADTTNTKTPDAGKPDGEGTKDGATTTTDAGKQQDVDKGKEGQADGKDGGKQEAAPVDYAKTIAEVEMPEGFVLDQAAAKAGGELFAKHKLPAEAVKDLVSLYAQQQKAGADGNAKAFADQVSGWKASAEKETTPEERGVAKEAALKVFGKDEVALLELFGVTNRAGFIKSMAKVGKAIGDDTFVPGDAKGNGARERSRYPNSKMNP